MKRTNDRQTMKTTRHLTEYDSKCAQIAAEYVFQLFQKNMYQYKMTLKVSGIKMNLSHTKNTKNERMSE